jgi:hypothetical protein
MMRAVQRTGVDTTAVDGTAATVAEEDMGAMVEVGTEVVHFLNERSVTPRTARAHAPPFFAGGS